ncbi:MAG: ADP-glyceromanno-heptose 6-epimerase [Akkermansia sp.]
MIIVTGGAGFIGSNIIAALEEQGRTDIVVADSLGTDEKWKNIAKRELRAIIPPEELLDFIRNHVSEIDAIIHMGAISATTEKDADLIVRTNLTLTQKLWKFCADYQKQFIYASSAATYGDGTLGFSDDSDLAHLKSLRPLNAYGWSKSLVDVWSARNQAEGLAQPCQCAGLKFFNVYGPNEYHKGGQKSVVAHIYPNVSRNETVQLFKSYNPHYADGWQLRDFVWVGDCVNVVLWLLNHPEISGLFNVGSGEARSFYDLAKATFNALDLPEKIAFKDMPAELQGKYQYYTKADLSNLRAMGYTAPMTQLEEGVGTYVKNYLSQEDIYR